MYLSHQARSTFPPRLSVMVALVGFAPRLRLPKSECSYYTTNAIVKLSRRVVLLSPPLPLTRSIRIERNRVNLQFCICFFVLLCAPNLFILLPSFLCFDYNTYLPKLLFPAHSQDRMPYVACHL